MHRFNFIMPFKLLNFAKENIPKTRRMSYLQMTIAPQYLFTARHLITEIFPIRYILRDSEWDHINISWAGAIRPVTISGQLESVYLAFMLRRVDICPHVCPSAIHIGHDLIQIFPTQAFIQALVFRIKYEIVLIEIREKPSVIVIG